MTDDKDKTRKQADDDASFANLMKLAGERPEIPLSVESRVYHEVQQEWQAATVEPNADKVYEKVHKSWRRNTLRGTLLRWMVPAGVAATAVIAMAMVFVSQVDEPTPLRVAATVSRVVGTGPISTEYSQGAPVHAGVVISTGPNEGLSLLLARSESLRIDENTRIRVDAADQFTLLAGRIYADTGQFVYRNGGLKIDTEFGVVTDVGTQFSVATTEQSLEVAVREGRVDVRNQADAYAARMGQRLTLVQGAGASVTDLDTHDDYWDWVVDLTPKFDMTNKSLLDFLKWAARETGRELQFVSNESRMFAMRTDVHGSADGLTPDQALEAVLATTTVRYQIKDDKIIIDI
jgi:ferric-dicitrate binding protein FerR (iron transport regulator)